MAFVVVYIPFANVASKRAAFALRFQTISDPTQSEVEAMANAAQAEWHHADTQALYAVDMTLALPTAHTYERMPAVGTKPAYFRRTMPDISATGAPASVNGTVAGQSTPPQIAQVVRFGTNTFTRRARGRVYTPPPPEANVDGAGNITGSQLYVDRVREICEAVEASNIPLNIDHIVHSVTYDQTFEVVTYGADTNVETQRRRAAR